ncbi:MULTISPECIES: helix-turn-helix domain-containing protein [Ruegeria]|uniref:Putative transcriptional regulator n=1 Tax=Ruegeria denitrificans TaxID=1715692 RepID=A0A0P1IRB4_9RHOB|nr:MULTISPECIES: helix-turn-helix transcriptional regulator [Ruegeria]NOD49981.1 helix-turn-helix domain-containing protein [Ruegeria sp. HKCCD5849]CUJ97733.1 putative transcriptional regulator [Ruegeria denitrificans]
MTVPDLGVRLAAVRTEARLSQEEMAQRLSISRSAYQYYERGQRDLTATLLLKVYEEFDVDPLWMLEGDTAEGKSRRHSEMAHAYRKLGIAVEHRIINRGLVVAPEKKWDAIDFLFKEALSPETIEGLNQVPDIARIDTILRLVA